MGGKVGEQNGLSNRRNKSNGISHTLGWQARTCPPLPPGLASIMPQPRVLAFYSIIAVFPASHTLLGLAWRNRR